MNPGDLNLLKEGLHRKWSLPVSNVILSVGSVLEMKHRIVLKKDLWLTGSHFTWEQPWPGDADHVSVHNSIFQPVM